MANGNANQTITAVRHITNVWGFHRLLLCPAHGSTHRTNGLSRRVGIGYSGGTDEQREFGPDLQSDRGFRQPVLSVLTPPLSSTTGPCPTFSFPSISLLCHAFGPVGSLRLPSQDDRLTGYGMDIALLSIEFWIGVQHELRTGKELRSNASRNVRLPVVAA